MNTTQDENLPQDEDLPQDEAGLLTPEQLARRLNVSRRCLGNWARAGIIPRVKIGRVCRFDLRKVRAALAQYEQVASTTTTTTTTAR